MIRIFIESGVNKALDRGKETTNEQDFVEKFILYHFPQMRLEDFEIIGTGGKDKLGNTALKFIENTIDGGTNIVIFDADTSGNKGGFSKRKAEILKAKEDYNIEFDLFLWPNNHADGDFESMLLQITQHEHRGLIDCYRKYEKSVTRLDRGKKLYQTSGRKGEIFSYIASLRKTRKENEKFGKGYWAFQNPKYWDLDSAYLQPLKEFLKKYLTNCKHSI